MEFVLKVFMNCFGDTEYISDYSKITFEFENLRSFETLQSIYRAFCVDGIVEFSSNQGKHLPL